MSIDALKEIRQILDALPPPKVMVMSVGVANVFRANAGLPPMSDEEIAAASIDVDWQIREGDAAAGPDAPPRVANVEEHWGSDEPPPAPSPRLLFWVERLRAGWQPPERLAQWGYYETADIYGVWIWEVFNVLWPMLGGKPIEPTVAEWLRSASPTP